MSEIEAIHQPLVSVLMLTYNHENFIVQALDSILMQQVDFAFDIVVGDDCSSDNTRKILTDYQTKYPHIFKLLFHEKNIGAANNHIAVMQAGKGKYVAMCEGDDYWTDPKKLQKQIDYLEKNPAFSMVCHRIKHLFDETSESKSWAPEFFENNDFGKEFTIDTFLKDYFLATVSIVYRTSCIDNKAVKELHNFKDIFLFALLLDKGKGMCLNEEMAIYRIHQQGIYSMQSNIKRLRSNVLTGIAMCAFFNMKKKSINDFTLFELENLYTIVKRNKRQYVEELRLTSYHLSHTFRSRFRTLQRVRYRLVYLSTLL